MAALKKFDQVGNKELAASKDQRRETQASSVLMIGDVQGIRSSSGAVFSFVLADGSQSIELQTEDGDSEMTVKLNVIVAHRTHTE